MSNNIFVLNIADDNSADAHDADNMSIVSDITEIATLPDESEREITCFFENKLQKMTVDELKDKCKENFIIGLSKLKKNELIQLLMNSFVNIWTFLKTAKLQDLRDIYKTNKIKDKYSNGTSKKHIINNIMSYNSKCETLLFIKSINYNIFQNSQSEKYPDTPHCLVENPQPQRFPEKEAENAKLKEASRLQAEEQLKDTLKVGRQQKEKEKLKEPRELIEKPQRLQEDADAEVELKKKKAKIPKNVKINVWNTHIDPNIQRHKCLCCKKSIISITDFHVGHVISENAGGTLEINNLRPICASCNYSMGTTNMIDYIVKYGYYLS